MSLFGKRNKIEKILELYKTKDPKEVKTAMELLHDLLKKEKYCEDDLNEIIKLTRDFHNHLEELKTKRFFEKTLHHEKEDDQTIHLFEHKIKETQRLHKFMEIWFRKYKKDLNKTD